MGSSLHEAGHCLIGAYVRRRIRHVVVNQWDTEGVTSFCMCEHYREPSRDRRIIKGEIMIVVAGDLAENPASKEHWQWLQGKDLEAVQYYRPLLGADPERTIRDYTEEARRVLADNQTTLINLIALIFAKKAVKGGQIYECLRASGFKPVRSLASVPSRRDTDA